MKIEILGAESLGVRGLACWVEAGDQRVLIDPGVALGLVRHGQQPHPVQVAVAESVRADLVGRFTRATDLVFSHFHGDHVPLAHPNPYQLGLDRLPPEAARLPAWRIGDEGLSDTSLHRCRSLTKFFGERLQVGEGRTVGSLAFSRSVPHGEPDSPLGRVMMTRVRDDRTVFVHASDIQLLHAPTIDRILAWQPDIVLAAGPPLYLDVLDDRDRQAAWDNALRLALGVETVILDHHLLRDESGLDWIEALAQASGNRVTCAAQFMGHRPWLLEARRRELYQRMPVPEDWHERYARGEEDASAWLEQAEWRGWLEG